MPDGRILVRAGCAATAADEVLPRRALTGKSLGTLHLPAVSFRRAQTAAAIPDGAALLLGGDGDDRGPWLLEVRRAARPALQRGDLAAVALGHLALAPLSPEREPDPVRRPGEDHWSSDSDEATDVGRLLELLAGAEAGDARILGSHAVFVGQERALERVRAAVRQQAQRQRTWSLRWRLGSVPAAMLDDVADGRLTAEALAAELPGRGALATLEGNAFVATLGREQAFVRDYDVEIAQAAAMANPIVDTFFAGWSIRGMVLPGPDDLPLCTVRLLWAEVPPFQPTDPGTEELGGVDHPVTLLADAEHRTTLRPGRWQIVHRQPDPGAPEELALVLALRLD
jgi:hypothetical protein